MKINIRPIVEKDIDIMAFWTQIGMKWQETNGPYFGEDAIDEKWIQSKKKQFQESKSNFKYLQAIVDENDNMLGTVNWYWKSIETYWMEIGIVIYDDKNWGKEIGKKALTIWINYLFDSNPELVRIGLTSWSGNIRMIKLAKKLGMQEEARYRNARIVKGLYYDSLSYGILKDEWIQQAI